MNPRYFADSDGRVVLLTGSHTWMTLQDRGPTLPVPRFRFDEYLDFLATRNHNFIRLWITEVGNWMSESPGDYWTDPMPYRRTGPGMANDGRAKYDLDSFDESYFNRLRERVQAAGRRGMYVSVMLFNGWSVESKGRVINNPWRGHPFHRANNINGVNGDVNDDESGRETHTLQLSYITRRQEAYLRKVVDIVGDLDNVLYEISNESNIGSLDWQVHLIRYLREYQAQRPMQHPIGMTNEFPASDYAELLESPADWISPGAYQWKPPPRCWRLMGTSAQSWLRRLLGDGVAVDNFTYNPPAADGRKVVVTDTDHLWGIGGDRRWAWRSFTRGHNPIFMDTYDQAASVWLDASIPPHDSPQWESLRESLGDIRALSSRIPLASMTPTSEIASSKFALSNASTGDYVVYVPEAGRVSVNLSRTVGELSVTWFDPAERVLLNGGRVAGGSLETFDSPFDGDAVLWIRR